MNNEIKEILDNLGFTNEDMMWCDEITLNTKQSHLLLDYITNLQKQLHQASLDIQELTERDIYCPTSCDKLTNLQEENERLKDYYMGMVKIADKRLDRYLDYKSRCEKAIEILKVMNRCDNWIGRKRTNIIKLLNILQNGSDEDA